MINRKMVIKLIGTGLAAVILLAACQPNFTFEPPVPPPPIPTDTPTAAATLPPIATTPTLTSTPDPSRLFVPLLSISGLYPLTFSVSSDPTGDKDKIAMPANLDLMVLQKGKVLTFSASKPWIDVTGILNDLDGSFKASGTGVVAGFPNTSVELDGNITPKSGLAGKLTMFADNGLPTDHSIVYAAVGQRAQVMVSEDDMQSFLDELDKALATNDIEWLFANLNSENANLYSEETCQAHFEQRKADPSYKIAYVSMTGPAGWVYAPPGKAQLTISDVYTVIADVTEQSQTSQDTLHFAVEKYPAVEKYHLTWFTMCTTTAAPTWTPNPAAGAANPAYSQASQFAGLWNGSWNNTTYSTTGAISAQITVQPDGTLSTALTLGGKILGVGSPLPLTIKGTYDANGVIFGGTAQPIFGDLTVTISYSGAVSMQAQHLPVPGISQVSAQGTLQGTKFNFKYTVTFFTGASAVGTATLTRSP
jgi:hypothetical protein